MIGAHPAYPDLVGFGRRSLNCSTAEIAAMITYQIAALDGMAQSLGLQVNYVKPHGALYNDMMVSDQIRAVIMQTVAAYWRPLRLMLQATPKMHKHEAEADRYGVRLWREAFADRCYIDDGKLMPRNQAGAVHSHEQMLDQVKQLVHNSSVTTHTGKVLSLQVDSLCVHGDNDVGIASIQAIRQCLQQTQG
jgi:5-oxoprolinase (ATP-hydrolysing) subunit A